MKTIAMNFEEYQSEMLSERRKGHVEGFRRAIEILKAKAKKDFSEAVTILMEEFEDEPQKSIDEALKVFGLFDEAARIYGTQKIYGVDLSQPPRRS